MGKVGMSAGFGLAAVKTYRFSGTHTFSESAVVRYTAIAKHDGIVFASVANDTTTGEYDYGTSVVKICLNQLIVTSTRNSHPKMITEARPFGASTSAVFEVHQGDEIMLYSDISANAATYHITALSTAGNLDFQKTTG